MTVLVRQSHDGSLNGTMVYGTMMAVAIPARPIPPDGAIDRVTSRRDTAISMGDRSSIPCRVEIIIN